MVPHGPPAPLSGAQPVPPSLLRSNSNLSSVQGSGMPSQNNAFPSLVSPRNQLNNINMLGNAPNVSSLLQQSFNNGGPNSGLSVLGKRRLIENGVESDPLSGVANVTAFNPSPYMSVSITTDPNSSGQVQGQQFPNPSGNQMLADQLHTQQLDPQNFQHNQHQLQQFSVPGNQRQQPFQTMQAGLGGVGPVKQETCAMNDETQQQLQALRNLGTIKLEPLQIQNMRSLAPVNMESRQPEPSSFLNKQQQQQLLLSRQSPQAAAAAQILHQQRLVQIQRQQQQRALNAIPQQKSQLQAQFQPQNLSIRSPVKTVYEPGMGAQRLTYYMYQQQQRPEDNNIEFWRKFVAEFFAPNAKKKWCVSMYASGRQTTGVLNQDVWHCEICNRKPGRGYEATAEVLPRLFKIKFESGTMEELLYVDMPKESQNSSGQIVLDYAKAIQESVFEQLRVVRDGQLRIILSPDLKICSWEFCARHHEELVPKRLLIPQVSQLRAAAQKYQTATQNMPSDVSVSELQNNCNMFVASAHQLGKALEVPLVNDVGYTKRYVRCLQISEVVNSMKDLIDYSSESRSGPMESLSKYPRLNPPHDFQGEPQQPGGHLQQQRLIMVQNLNNNGSVQTAAMQQLASTNGGIPRVSNTLNSVASITSADTNIGLVHQNSTNSRQQNPMYAANSPYEGNNVPMPSPGSSNTMPQPQSSPAFQSQTLPSSSNPLQQTSRRGLSGAHVNSNLPYISMQQPAALSGDTDANDSQSSVQKIIQEMMSSQLGGGSMMNTRTMSNDVKNVNGLSSSINSSGLSGRNGVIANGVANGNLNIGGAGFGTMGNGLGQSGMVDGIRATLENNSMNMNRRAAMTVAQEQSTNQPQPSLENQLLGGLGAANGFNDFQLDWKTSP